MKKLLLLGGSQQQVIAIETAKKLGYYTILCDYLDDNPGQYVTDKYYPVSTTDREAVLSVAIKENVDGVIAYASDPAAPTAAYVAEKLGLPTNPLSSVEKLCNKDEFRSFLNQNGFNTPASKSYFDTENAVNEAKKFIFPILVKPVDSSGSKGVTIVNDSKDMRNAVELAFSYSRSKRIIIEEYIENKNEFLIGGDIFVYEGKVVIWGLMNCHRDKDVNPLVPVGKSFPSQLDEEEVKNVRLTLQALVDTLNIKSGAMNVELVIGKDDKVYLLDVGPRNGGNMIPDMLGLIFNTDIIAMSVKVALGEPLQICKFEGVPFYALYVLHSDRDGVLLDIRYSDEIERFIIQKHVYKIIGDRVEYFDNASKAIGIIFMKFSSEYEMMNFMSNIKNHIQVKVERIDA